MHRFRTLVEEAFLLFDAADAAEKAIYPGAEDDSRKVNVPSIVKRLRSRYKELPAPKAVPSPERSVYNNDPPPPEYEFPASPVDVYPGFMPGIPAKCR